LEQGTFAAICPKFRYSNFLLGEIDIPILIACSFKSGSMHLAPHPIRDGAGPKPPLTFCIHPARSTLGLGMQAEQ
jgi:hypothetical protein